MKIDNSCFEKISEDILESEKIVSQLNGNIVTIFGSARVKESSDHYQETIKLSKNLADKGYHILTGGGPGIMEAGNRGASESASKSSQSIGFNIQLKKEQKLNSYATQGYTFNKIFIRKQMLINFSKIFVIFQGGFGTLDELFELLVLAQNSKVKDVQIYLYDSEFYNPLLNFLEVSLVKNGMIEKDDLKLFKVVDSIDEILENISR